MTDSRIIQKLKKLLAMANDKSSENEVMTAARQLHVMLAKHNMSMDQLDTGDDAQEQIDKSFESHKCRPWKRVVAFKIAQLYFCEMYYVKMGNGKSNYFFVGTEANRTFAMAIFNMVVKTNERESRVECRKVHGKEVAEFVNSFWTGAMHRIYDRCDQLIKAAKEGSLQDEEGTTLPAMVSTYDLQAERTKQYLSTMKLKTKVSRTRATDANGLNAGKAAGDKVQLSRSLQSKSSTKLIGN